MRTLVYPKDLAVRVDALKLPCVEPEPSRVDGSRVEVFGIGVIGVCSKTNWRIVRDRSRPAAAKP